MYKVFLSIRHFLGRIYATIYSTVVLFHDRTLCQGDCYFPELGRQKSKRQVFIEQLQHVLKYGYCNKFYFLYGFDIQGFRRESEYVDYNQFMIRRNKLNYASFSNPIAILRDKSLFGITAAAYGISTPPIVGVVSNGSELYLFSEKETVSLTDYFKTHSVDLFLKVIDGECADGVFHIVCDTHTITQSGRAFLIDEFVATLNANTRYILQERIPTQHPDIAALHDKAINTIRLVTVINPQAHKPCVFSAVLRVGRGASEVDNWAAGGLSIGINTDTAELAEYGFYKPGYGTKASVHPDSGIVFKGYKVPYMQEAISEALRFHELLKGIHSIGWDIAVTENGPCFVEGNDNWEISLMQISNHGLMKEYSQLFK